MSDEMDIPFCYKCGAGRNDDGRCPSGCNLSTIITGSIVPVRPSFLNGIDFPFADVEWSHSLDETGLDLKDGDNIRVALIIERVE